MSVLSLHSQMFKGQRPGSCAAFTLVETLVVIATAGVLFALVIPAMGTAQSRARIVECASTLRTLGQGFQLYAAEHQSELPRSWHSAGSQGEPGWAASIAPYLGVSQEQMNADWPTIFNKHYRSPADDQTSPFFYSYAMNVYFELDPSGDDYIGSPATWRRLIQVPKPGQTVLLAQTRPVMFGDHLMAHQWSGIAAAKNALLHEAHTGRAHYLFVDGHVELLKLEEVFNPAQGVNAFHPDRGR